MLVLNCVIGEPVVLRTPQGDITVIVTRTRGRKVRIGIEAPKSVLILRSELQDPERKSHEHL